MRTLLVLSLLAIPSQTAPIQPLECEMPYVQSMGKFTVTSYQSLKSQTDDSPFWTSIGHRVHGRGVAASRDLLCPVNKHCRRNVRMFCKPEMVHYEDVVWIEGYGAKVVFDCMGSTKWDKVNKRRIPIRRAFDIWVPNYRAEKAIGTRTCELWRVR